MILLKFIAFSILGMYSIIILLFTIGWYRIKEYKTEGKSALIPISIVIACRNEEENISKLIDTIIKQTYPKNYLEVILVNDHSEDTTEKIIKKYVKNYDFIKYYKLPKSLIGKKEAISYGINKSPNEIIITTDADCTTTVNWVNSLVNYYQNKKPKLLVGPVCLKTKNSFCQKIQSLEFLSLIASGAGAIGIHHPIMSNGANLLFEKSLFQEINQHLKFISGDDIFLLLQTKLNHIKKIHFIKSQDAIVYTHGSKSLNDFFNQRIRWTSKSKAYRDFDIIFTALIVALTNLVMALCLVGSVWEISLLVIFIILFFLKSFADLFLLFPVLNFCKKNKLLWLFIPLQVIYPFYIITTVLFGLIGNFSWKNRSFKEKG